MLKVSKVVGLNSDQEVALALVNLPLPIPSGELAKVDPGLFIIIKTSLEDAFSRARQALAAGEDTFYTSDLPISERMAETLKTLQSSLSDAQTLQILLAVSQADQSLKDVIYLMVEGEGMEATLYRDNNPVNLMTINNAGQLVSGFLEPGDRLMLSTNSFREVFAEDSDALQQLPQEDWESEVADKLPQGVVNPLAVIILQETVSDQIETKPLVSSAQSSVRSFQPSITLPKLKIPQLNLTGLIKLFPRNKKTLVYCVVGLLIIGIVSVVIFNQQKDSRQKNQLFEGYLNQATLQYQQAVSLKDSDQISATQTLDLAKQALTEALKLKPQDSKAISLRNQMEEATVNVLKIWQVSELPLWLDLDLVKKGMTAQKLSLSFGNLLILDSSSKTLVTVKTDSKAYTILAGPDKLGEASLASIIGQNCYTFAVDKGIIKIDLTNSDITTAVGKDAKLGMIADLAGFAGNIYLLDQGNLQHQATDSGQIWKYLPIEGGYSEKRSYLKNDTKVDFSLSLRMQIDSSIWILNKDGKIEKFTQGSRDDFTFKGLDKPIKNPISFYVSDKAEHLYILDSGNSRVVVFDKSGNYFSQYQSAALGGISDLVVDEQKQKIYLLGGSKIYQLELK